MRTADECDAVIQSPKINKERNWLVSPSMKSTNQTTPNVWFYCSYKYYLWYSGFFLKDDLGVASNACWEDSGQPKCFIKGVCVKRLSATKYCCKALHCGADDIIVGVLWEKVKMEATHYCALHRSTYLCLLEIGLQWKNILYPRKQRLSVFFTV